MVRRKVRIAVILLLPGREALPELVALDTVEEGFLYK